MKSEYKDCKFENNYSEKDESAKPLIRNKEESIPIDTIYIDDTKLITKNKNPNTILNPEKSCHINYRADIDGLRAVAITLVLIFHGWPKVLTGGFVGVDVFFVISGYLISSIIFKEYLNSKFSYLNFYYRRVKRIFPALIIVLIFSLVMGWLFLWQNELEPMSRTIIAGTLFSANFQIFLLKPGYFDADSRNNPLLHLWSLGVEEQFYIFWPFLASMIIISTKKRANILILCLTVSSFYLNIYGIYTNLKFAYYFPLCRFWQLLFGCALAYDDTETHSLRKIDITNNYNNMSINIISISGLFLIIFSSVKLNEKSLFPGFWALLPTFGSFLIIHSGEETFINKYILGSRIFVFIGKISYPLYLWHWPLLAFSRILYKSSSTSILSKPYTAIGISVLASIITYLLIEKPIQKIKMKKSLMTILSSLMILVLLIALLFLNYASDISLKTRNQNFLIEKYKKISNNIYTKPTKILNIFSVSTSLYKILQLCNRYDGEGIYERLHPIVNSNEDFTDFGINNAYYYNYVPGNKKVILWGDSFAEMLIFRIKHLHQMGIISPFPTVVIKVKTGSWVNLPCSEFNNGMDNYKQYLETLDYIKRTKPMSVLSVSGWSRYIKYYYNTDDMQVSDLCNIRGRKDYEYLFAKWIKDVKSITDLGIKFYYVNIKPDGYESPYNCNNMFDQYGLIQQNLIPFNYNEAIKDKLEFKEFINKSIKEAGAIQIDFKDNLCVNDRCPLIDNDGFPIHRDSNHFSRPFATEYLSVIDKVFTDK